MAKEIRLNAFDMKCVGHIQHGMWTHPRDRSMSTLDHLTRGRARWNIVTGYLDSAARGASA